VLTRVVGLLRRPTGDPDFFVISTFVLSVLFVAANLCDLGGATNPVRL